MKHISQKFFWTVVALFLLQSSSFASEGRGLRMFDQNLKKECGLNGIVVARSHTQGEWTKIYQDKSLNSTLQALCPQADPFKEKYLEDVYAFMHAYAKDSGKVVGGC